MMARAQSYAAAIPLRPRSVLRDRILPGLGMSVSQAARELRITRQTLHRILNRCKCPAGRDGGLLSRFVGDNTQFWLYFSGTRLAACCRSS
jgi:plasmid maintenance system antidote protein VapI